MKRKADISGRTKRFAEAVNLHAIEGQPLSQEQIAMFEKFERDGLSDEQCLAILRQKHSKVQDTDLAAE